MPPWGVPQRRSAGCAVRPLADLEGEYYLRFMALDRPGVLARIAGVLGRFDISIASVIQQERRAGTTVPVVHPDAPGARAQPRAGRSRAIDRLAVVRGPAGVHPHRGAARRDARAAPGAA